MIRTAKASDSQAIATVQVEGWQTAYNGLLCSTFLAELSVPRRADIWHSELKAGESVILVDAVDEIVRGFIDFGPDRNSKDAANVAEIRALYVNPSEWGRGIGTSLCESAFAMMRARNFNEVVLWILKGNDGPIKFYRKMGFTDDGLRKTDRIGNKDAEQLHLRMNL